MPNAPDACPEVLRLAFHELLYDSLVLMRNNCGDSQLVFALADHMHNVPGLLSHFTPDLLKFYWEVERPCFLESLPAGFGVLLGFAPHWAVIEREYRRICGTG